MKKLLILALVLTFGMTGVSFAGGFISRYDVRTIKMVQWKLRHRGYYSGSFDGVQNYRTNAALAKYKKDKGMEEKSDQDVMRSLGMTRVGETAIGYKSNNIREWLHLSGRNIDKAGHQILAAPVHFLDNAGHPNDAPFYEKGKGVGTDKAGRPVDDK